MKTLVDASAAFNQRAGIGRYARNILSRMLASDDGDAWTLVDAPEERGANPELFRVPDRESIRVVNLPFSRRNADRLWFKLGIPLDIRLFAGRADVVYSPDFTAPPMAGVPSMVTIHDLAFMTHPDKTTDALRAYLERAVSRGVERSEKIAVVSYATRERVIRLLNVPDQRVVVARNAVDDRFYRARPLSEAGRARLGVPERYLLMLGTIEPRKNHINALRAFEMAGVGRDMPLVIAGRPGWGFESAMERIEVLSNRGIVRMLSYVPEEDIPSLIAGATAMLYPSWTEGFGLPVAESLAAGIPVVTGNDAALQEVGGEYALYADPGDVDGLAEHIRHVVSHESTEFERRERREWTRQFSWESSTSIVLQNLRQMKSQTR